MRDFDGGQRRSSCIVAHNFGWLVIELLPQSHIHPVHSKAAFCDVDRSILCDVVERQKLG